MNDLPLVERLEKHRTLAAWLEYQLRQEQRTIRDLERQLADEQRRKDAAHAALHFKIEPARSSDGSARLHRGDCAVFPGGFGFITPVDAVVALRDEGTPIVPCDICNPAPALNGVRVPPVEK